MRKFIGRYTQGALIGSNIAWWSERLCLKARLWAVSRAMRARLYSSALAEWEAVYLCSRDMKKIIKKQASSDL